uniref:BTB domain-containing protein n=1 Tax=Panagrolaimus sp. PS1159 TaxID=55785 RepID=A0AC35FFC6_9BILA
MNSSFNEIVCPFEAEWKFHKADLLVLKDLEDGCLSGKYYYAYNIHGLQYCVDIFPNGDKVEKRRGETWAFLYINCSDERKINAEYTLSVESASYSESLINVYEKSAGHGAYVCKTAEFFNSKFFVDGELTIKVKGTLKAERPLISKICTPISMQWKIKEEDLKSKKESSGCLYSKRINVALFSGVKYYIAIRPNKINDKNESTTQLYLHLSMEKEKKIGAVFDFSIDSANFNCNVQNIFEESLGCGFVLCSTEDLFDPTKRYFVNGVLTVNLNGILMVEKDKIISLNCKNGLASTAKKNNKDFLIVIGDKKLKVHKQVLKDASLAFAGMLQSGMKESIENKMIIEDFEFKIVEAAIKLLYGVNGLRKFSFEEMLVLYRFADKYEIQHIMDLVEGYLIKEISPSNVVQLIQFSAPDSLNVNKLYQSSIAFFIECSKESTPVLGSESLDGKLLVSILLSTFRPNVDTDNFI